MRSGRIISLAAISTLAAFGVSARIRGEEIDPFSFDAVRDPDGQLVEVRVKEAPAREIEVREHVGEPFVQLSGLSHDEMREASEKFDVDTRQGSAEFQYIQKPMLIETRQQRRARERREAKGRRHG